MDERDDVHLEAEDPEAQEKAEGKVQKLRSELEELRKEKQEYMDGWQRSKADYVNALKRFESDLKTAKTRGTASALETLLPAFDALERAREHGEIPEGFQAIVRQFESALKTLGVEAIGAVGEKFNPALHEAFGTDAADSPASDDTVTAVLEKGWKIGDSIIRPAKVRVAHYAG